MIVLPFRGTTLEISLSNGGAAYIVRAPDGSKAICATTARAPHMLAAMEHDGRTAELSEFRDAYAAVVAVCKAIG